jgi:hypothetical protein
MKNRQETNVSAFGRRPTVAAAVCGGQWMPVIAGLVIATSALFARAQPPATVEGRRLPWTTPAAPSPPALRLPAGPADILARYDVGPSQLELLRSGQSLSAAEEDVLVKILFHFPRLGLQNIARWREPQVDWDAVVAAPADHRTKIYALRGRAKLVEKAEVLPEQSELYEFGHYYLVTLQLDDAPVVALVAVRQVPAAWEVGVPIDERAEADGMFLKVLDGTMAAPALLFTAQRVGWLPERPAPEHFVGPPQIALARLGMDISLWDDVRESKEPGLSAADREAFYRLLAVVAQPAAHALDECRSDRLDVVPLLAQPKAHLGEVFPVEGTARRITRIAVGDADVRSRFGLDHYYEIDLFVPLGKASLRLGGEAGQEAPVFHNAFPATLIVRELPPGLSEGENVHEQVRATGVFFKVWTYRSKFTSRFGQLQPAPLFVADRPEHVPLPSASNWLAAALVSTALALALLVSGIIAVWYRVSDRKRATARLTLAERPDFSGLKNL